jgi:hypothetical protein
MIIWPFLFFAIVGVLLTYVAVAVSLSAMRDSRFGRIQHLGRNADRVWEGLGMFGYFQLWSLVAVLAVAAIEETWAWAGFDTVSWSRLALLSFVLFFTLLSWRALFDEHRWRIRPTRCEHCHRPVRSYRQVYRTSSGYFARNWRDYLISKGHEATSFTSVNLCGNCEAQVPIQSQTIIEYPGEDDSGSRPMFGPGGTHGPWW